MVTLFGSNENRTLSRRWVVLSKTMSLEWHELIIQFRHTMGILLLIWMSNIGVTSLPLTGLFGQYGYHPNLGCNLLRCNNSGSKVSFYLIYIMGNIVPCIAALITSILIFKQFFCFCISYTNFCSNESQKVNLKDHLIFSVAIILYIFCNLIFTFLETFVSPPSYSTEGFILMSLFLILAYSLMVYIRLYILLSPKCKEILIFLFRDINSVVTNSKSIIMSKYDSGNNVSNCRVNSL